MTKQEPIEEMVSIMAASNNPFVDVPVEIMPQVAKALYNAGYRKIPEDSVMLSKEIKAQTKQAKIEAVKEFAEKLKIKAIRLSAIENCHVCNLIDELLKEYEK